MAACNLRALKELRSLARNNHSLIDTWSNGSEAELLKFLSFFFITFELSILLKSFPQIKLRYSAWNKNKWILTERSLD